MNEKRTFKTKRRLVIERNPGQGWRRRWRWSVEEAYFSGGEDWKPSENGYAMTLNGARTTAYRRARLYGFPTREEAVVVTEKLLTHKTPEASIAKARHL